MRGCEITKYTTEGFTNPVNVDRTSVQCPIYQTIKVRDNYICIQKVTSWYMNEVRERGVRSESEVRSMREQHTVARGAHK